MRPRARTFLFGSLGALALGVGALVACVSGFDPQSKVDSVRLFGVRADKPYAKPGDDVNLEVLMTDARKVKARPLKLYWIPVVCVNPRDDLYYLCFAPPTDAGPSFIPAGPLADAGLEGGVDAGGFSGAALDNIPTGIDLGPFLPQGTTFSFHMPANAVQPRQGIDPYGIAIVFNIACAGQVRLAARDPSGGPQQVPVLCTDEDGNKLPPSDYVIGISRVYAYDTRTNANPVIEKMTKDGVDVDQSAGITVDTCKAEKRADCKEIKIDVRVPDDAWEVNPAEVGVTRHEQVWVDYYSDIGEFDSDARLLFDTTKGRVSESETKYRAPADPVDGTLWAVVHDNRGGAAFYVTSIHVR